MKEIAIIFPNQLHRNSEVIEKKIPVYLIEEFLFFNQYNFHKQKIVFHRSSMKEYESYLINKSIKVSYIDSFNQSSDIRNFIKDISSEVDKIHVIDPVDYLLEKRLKKACIKYNLSLEVYDNPSFINSNSELEPFFRNDKVKFFQTSFYKEQRKKYNILIQNSKPEGGRWTYDDENRKKYPKDKKPPKISFSKKNKFYEEATSYVNKHYADNIGIINENVIYPSNFDDADKWLNSFLETRYREFGPYEDAIVKEEIFLNHSLLSPLINSGILSPKQIINETIKYYKKHNIPINSCEGFIRQVIGWREFIRGVYKVKGSFERTRNFWGFNKKIPKSFYDGTTGIDPIDDTINKVHNTAYCHHIERLMVLGNFMLLCEFDPDEIYKWFMEFFIDSYDWVMVPNVYGMSQFADGGLMSTKPYISGSSYIIKMSNYKNGEWSKIWDSLFWRFLDKQRDFFIKNPRMRMLVNSYDKMDQEKKENLRNTANKYLKEIEI